ncbi:hypothetical protein, partial [Thiolapillus sp.]|uniref:hypothetical protein n=1 Tax=Thiolapillus sp. TaxID=2017437 RepID=UPI003AF5F2FC
WTPHLDAYFASPLALCARRVSSAASRLLGSTSLRFALHGWQRENHFSRRVPWQEKWAIGLSWPRPGAQKRRNQGIGERCGLAFFCKISHRVLNRPENSIYSDNVTLSCYLTFQVHISLELVQGTWYMYNRKSEPSRITRKWLNWGNKGGESRKAVNQ